MSSGALGEKPKWLANEAFCTRDSVSWSPSSRWPSSTPGANEGAGQGCGPRRMR